MRLAGFDVDIVVQGFPGKSVCHGGLGWCSIALIRQGGRIVVLDTGAIGMRGLVLHRLKERGVRPEDVTDLILTHAHHDHAINWPMFSRARIYLGSSELRWALDQPLGLTAVPEFSIMALDKSPQLQRIEDGEEIMPGITAFSTPGHTPGHLAFLMKGRDRDLIFTGDAAKNRAELLSRDTDMTFDAAQSAASIDRIWELWRRRPGNLVVPGHDIPMELRDGKPSYLGKREAAISAWFGTGMSDKTIFELSLKESAPA